LLLLAMVLLGVRFARQNAQPASSGRNAQAAGPGGKVQLLKQPTSVPSVTMRTIDGRTISTSDWHGRVTIVNFWATWCGPCRYEIPDLVALQEKYRDVLQIIGVSEDEDPPEAVQRFADQYHINYPIVMRTEAIAKAFPGVYALPTSFMIDRKLQVMQKHV